MKRRLSLFVLTLLLVSCGTPSTPAPPATLIPSAIAVPTRSSTTTPEASPTATKDPNAPEVYTRFEKGIYYLDEQTESGNTLTYTWDVERQAWLDRIYYGYLLDQPKWMNDENADWSADQLMMNIYIDSIFSEKMPFAVSHKDNTDASGVPNFYSALFWNAVPEAWLRQGLIKDEYAWDMRNWVARELYVDFTAPDGGSYRWGHWPGTTVNVHILGNYDELKENTATNGYYESRSITLNGPEITYMVKIWADEENNLQVDIAPSIPAEQWTKDIFAEMAFKGPGDVFETSTLPAGGGVTGTFVYNQNALPYFTYTNLP